ncbi:MAG: nucleotidyltransferase domain-containing protein [Chloroflexota bacterium]
MSDLEPWEPLLPITVAVVLAAVPARWWIAGGWALDLFIGHQTRAHSDTDVAILRGDQLAVQEALVGWDLRAADPPGTLRLWKRGEALELPIHDIWCRRSPSDPWAFQLMLEDHNDAHWRFRRDQRVHLPLGALGWKTSDGFPCLVPEVQLLYKARPEPHPKDEVDFAVLVPLLSQAQRQWLRRALELTSPGHPWLPRLTQGAPRRVLR